MGLLPQNTIYSDKDYAAVRERSFNLVRSVFPSWTDTAVANFGNLLLESFAWILDILCFYQDQLAREGRLATCTMRKSMIALTKLIDYELPGASAAYVDVVVTIENASALTGTVTASGAAPIVVRTKSVTAPVRGELVLTAPFAIPVAAGHATFAWEHSITQPTYTVPGSNRPDQVLNLPFGPFLEGSEVVQTPTQGVFTRVDTFYYSGPSDRHYRIQVDQNDLAQVVFGDGVNGALPIGDISTSYRTGGGIAGNVEANGLVKIEGTFVDSEGRTAYLSCTNPLAAEGGGPREEVDGARENAPASIRTVNRTVAREDFEINARRVSGVGRALMMTSNEYPGIEENYGKLYIVPSTGGTPSAGLLAAVEALFHTPPPNGYPMTVTFQLEVLPVAYHAINLYMVVWYRSGYTPSVVEQAIRDALEDFFDPMLASGASNPNVDFGYNYKDADGDPAGEIAWSDLLNVVRDVEGVRKVGAGAGEFLLNGVRDDAAIPLWKFPSLGTVVIVNGDSGGTV